jgi:hypothetical protein
VLVAAGVSCAIKGAGVDVSSGVAVGAVKVSVGAAGMRVGAISVSVGDEGVSVGAGWGVNSRTWAGASDGTGIAVAVGARDWVGSDVQAVNPSILISRVTARARKMPPLQ